MKKTILSILTLIALSACSEQKETTTTVLDSKLDAVKMAKESVILANARTKNINLQTANVSSSSASLYSQKCASCHGKNAEKSALNASAAIAGWSSSKLQKSLQGYKAGNFGGSMKAIMQGQTKPLSTNQIKLISDYISIL